MHTVSSKFPAATVASFILAVAIIASLAMWTAPQQVAAQAQTDEQQDCSNGVDKSFTSEYTYSDAGIYTVTLTVTDGAGNADSESFEYVVVYDPNGGFVTGGGWIDVPVGAVADDPLASGRLSFGFNAKYKKNSAMPEGNTNVQFDAADLHFQSDWYDWLVVMGEPHSIFTGTGTINGDGDYGFTVMVADQATGDEFRIVIWDRADGSPIVDTGVDGQADTTIDHGSIVVHTKK